jgi:hypothetical protein
MAFDISDFQVYVYTDATFGATTVAHRICGPRGKAGMVRDIMVDVAVNLSGTTTVPEIDVGIASGDNTFGRYRLGYTATTAYPVGAWSASDEAWQGNPPRTLADYAGHVVLDGGPYGNVGIAGGSYGTQVPLGRIPAGPLKIINVVNGTANVVRAFIAFEQLTSLQQNWAVGQTVNVFNIQGATGGQVVATISAINTTQGYIELTGTTFGGAYTGGGYIMPIAFITATAGVGAPAGGGTHRVKIEWMGAENV